MGNPVPFYEMDVRTLATAIAQGEMNTMDLARESLARISSIEDRVQAWSILDEGEVLRQAETLSAELDAGKLRGPLHGVPVGVKEEFHVKGMPTRMRGLGELVPELEDATVVSRLRQAGAIIMGKTHMPVLGSVPPTRNPWNLEHNPGGSSSGSGAAVAARMVQVALGEQTAGSTIRPAAYCGVDGFKPTYGRVSRFGCYTITWSVDHVGIIGLNVEDIALVLSVIAGPDPRDPTTIPDPAPPASLNYENMSPPRIGIVRNFLPEIVEESMQYAVENSATRLEKGGAELIDVMLPEEFKLAGYVYRIISGAEGATFNSHRLAEGMSSGGFASNTDRRAGALIPVTYFLQASRIRSWLYEMLLGSFQGLDALLMPATPGPAPKGNNSGDTSLQSPWSLLGYPALSINGGLSPEGLPLGLQFVASPKNDFQLLRVGAWCERVLGRLPVPPFIAS
jgi:aspartyl-tRNA(Asn)/glutamyl-tRNA(Gln) amidotransferase subunit A